MIGLVLKAVTKVVHSLESPDAVEYAVRTPDGTILMDGDPTDRRDQEERLVQCRGKGMWPGSELVERPVWYGEWKKSQ